MLILSPHGRDVRLYTPRYRRDVREELSYAQAILLDREARSSTLLADPHHGRIREPLLKVLHLMRAQDFASRGGQEVEFEGLTRKIGQMVHEAPSVFSFYESDYSPEGVVLQSGLAAPEAQLLTGANIVGYANGVSSLIKCGLSNYNGGLGGGRGGCTWPSDGGLNFAPAAPLCQRSITVRDATDVTIREASPDETTNSDKLRADLDDEGGQSYGLLKFDLTTVQGCSVTKATLRLWASVCESFFCYTWPISASGIPEISRNSHGRPGWPTIVFAARPC